MVQMFMRDLKTVSALWSVHFRVSALVRFCCKGIPLESVWDKTFCPSQKGVRFRGSPLQGGSTVFSLDICACYTAQKKWSFPLKILFIECEQIPKKLRICSHLLKKSLMENSIFEYCQSQAALRENLRIQSEYRKTRTRKNFPFGHFSRQATQRLS